MLDLEKNEYNEVTFQFIQALLFKVTDTLLSITCLAGKNELDINADFEADKMSDLDRELMISFETEIRNRLPAYEIKLTINAVSADDFNKNARNRGNELCKVLFLRFNKLWW